MENLQPEWVGKSCGQHGPYTFFKTFRYSRNNKWKTLSLGDFFFVRCSENEPLCIAELQLLWETKNAEGIKLSSSRLYFLPECTPEGRMEWHGEDEVLAVRGKVVLKVEDLQDWIVTDVEWSHGGPTIWTGDIGLQGEGSGKNAVNSLTERKEDTHEDRDKSQVIILSYNKYCRHKAILKRVENTGQRWMSCPEVQAMGLLLVPHKGTRMLFCRDEFEHPSLADNEQLCDHLAPKLKGRPRKKRTSATEQEVGSDNKQVAKVVHMTRATVKKEKELQPLRRTRRKRGKIGYPRKKAESKEEADFLESLYKFMQERSTPIERLPCLGFKQINLFLFFKTTQQFGGYDIITSQRLWKKVYIELGGNPGCTSAATCTRRLYERYIQPFVIHISGNKGNKIEKSKPKKRKKTKRKQLETEQKETEKEVRPRKRVKKVREHLEEIKKMQAEKQAEQNGVHFIQVHDLSTVHPASLPGHTLDANFNIEKKDTLASLASSSVPPSGFHPSHCLKPEDLRHKLNSKQQQRTKVSATKLGVSQELPQDMSFQTVDSFAETVHSKSSSPLSMVSRPSVIQHTHRPQKSASAAKEMKLHHHQAIQPSDLILRDRAQHLEKRSDSKKGSKPSTDMQVNNFPRPFVFPPGMPFVRPFMPYMNPVFMRGAVPMMAFHPKLHGQGSSSPVQVTHSKYTSNHVEDLKHAKSTKAHQVPVIQPSSGNTSMGLAEQEEPCDLSLPKKRKEDKQNEVPKVKREKVSFGNSSVEALRNGINENQRAAYEHDLQRLVAMHNTMGQSMAKSVEEEKHRSSPAKRVKMTPPSRGSITQGVISTQQSTSCSEPAVKRENPSTPDSVGTTDIKPIPIVYPNMSGFMAASRGMTPFPFMPQFFRPGFPPMVQTPSGLIPQTPFLPPHSPLLGSTVPTSLALNQEAMLPRGVIVPSPLAFASSVYRTPLPSMATDKQPAS